MYKTKNAWEGLEGVAADIMLNINTKQGTDENIFIIREKVRLQLSGLKKEILNSISTAKDRADLKSKIEKINIDEGF